MARLLLGKPRGRVCGVRRLSLPGVAHAPGAIRERDAYGLLVSYLFPAHAPRTSLTVPAQVPLARDPRGSRPHPERVPRAYRTSRGCAPFASRLPPASSLLMPRLPPAYLPLIPCVSLAHAPFMSHSCPTRVSFTPRLPRAYGFRASPSSFSARPVRAPCVPSVRLA